MKTLGIITGIAMEAKLLERFAGSPNLLVGYAGLTPGAPQIAAEKMIVAGATALMSFGLAGGLNPAVSAGAVVIPAEVRGADTLACDLAWTKRLAALMETTPSLLAHAAAVLTSAQAKADLFAATGAAAADMESYGIAEVASIHGLPFAALRVVADTAADAIPSAALKAMTDDGRLRPGAAALGALMRPWQIPELVRLGRRTAVAMSKLETLARLGAPSLFGLM
jgi:adenosylhomocysteine nucleosidase